MKTPPELDRITDAILKYRPAPKTKAAKKRIRRKKRMGPMSSHQGAVPLDGAAGSNLYKEGGR